MGFPFPLSLLLLLYFTSLYNMYNSSEDRRVQSSETSKSGGLNHSLTRSLPHSSLRNHSPIAEVIFRCSFCLALDEVVANSSAWRVLRQRTHATCWRTSVMALGGDIPLMILDNKLHPRFTRPFSGSFGMNVPAIFKYVGSKSVSIYKPSNGEDLMTSG